MTQTNRPIGMRAFTIVWVGQIISLLGSAMTGFGVTLWIYEGTEKATALALGGFFYMMPLLLLSPVAGALVDRYNRKLMMMLSDLSAALTTAIVLILFATGNLQIWHLYITATVGGIFQVALQAGIVGGGEGVRGFAAARAQRPRNRRWVGGRRCSRERVEAHLGRR